MFQTHSSDIYGAMVGDVIPEPPIHEEQTVIRLVIDNPIYTINGIHQTSDAAPFIDPTYNRTMVPLRVVAEALGAQVDWDAEIRTVIISGNGVTLSIQVDASLPDGMGAPIIVSGRTFVPIAYVAQMLGANVHWDGDNRAVYIQQ